MNMAASVRTTAPWFAFEGRIRSVFDRLPAELRNMFFHLELFDPEDVFISHCSFARILQRTKS